MDLTSVPFLPPLPRPISPVQTHQDVNDIDGAIKHIIDVLGDTYDDLDERRIIYFDGWAGLGASATLKAIAKVFKFEKCEDLHFDIVIHIDCSMWKSRRAMQRIIVEELKLDSVLAMIDKQDELDDFRGEPEKSRREIQKVRIEINGALENHKFLLIFHNGSDYEIDISTLGIPPLNMYSKSRMVWTYRGRFRTSSVTKEMLDHIPNAITVPFKPETELKNWHAILHEEASEIVEYTGMHDIKPTVVVDCFLYQLFLRDSLNWDAHSSNYWICDGIIQEETAWEVSDALQAEMRCDNICEWSDKDHKNWMSVRKSYKHWSIINDIDSTYNLWYPHDETSTYLLAYTDHTGTATIPNDLFKGRSKKLCVLKLALCAFDFASPPFLQCDSLRLLCLDHCTNNGRCIGVVEHKRWPCLRSLWVLDLCYTDWDWILSPNIMELMTHLRELNIKGAKHCTLSHMQQWLPNVHKLRVMESSYMEVDSLASMTNLVLLDLSGNNSIQVLPSLSSATSLKVLVLDGCVRLEHVSIDSLLLLESFSFDGYGPAYKWRHSMQLPENEMRPDSYKGSEYAKISSISLKGCARLENLFLRGLPNLEELDLSGTAVKSVDPYAMELRELKRLFLLSCEQLRCITLNSRNNRALTVLHVDTHRKGIVDHSRSCSIRDLSVHLVFTNGRFLRSLYGIYSQNTYGIFERCINDCHLHISSAVHSQAEYNCKEADPSKVSFIQTRLFLYSDVFARAAHPNSWTSPQVLLPLQFHIEIGEGSINLEGIEESKVLAETMNWVDSLHVHDNSSITTVIPKHPRYYTKCTFLKWCHVERCPKLHAIVSDWELPIDIVVFGALQTFWASHLLNAHYIFSKGKGLGNLDNMSFYHLRYIHLDNCPRLRFVLPLTFNMNSLGSLETIHIEYCSELTHVFPMNDDRSIAANHTVEFPCLKLILLQELPKLQQICEAKMSAPALETIKMRGCWSLRRLPAVVHREDKPTVDCEKDCWDKLEWDNDEASHDPSLFKTRHSSYCKKTLSRISILR